MATQSTSDETVNIEQMYHKQSLRLIRRVIHKCEEEKSVGELVSSIKDPIKRASIYSGLHVDVLRTISENPDSILIELKEINRCDIHNELMKFYFTKKKIPTTRQLFNEFVGTLPVYVDIETFRKYLMKMDFIWQKLSGHTLGILERPEIVFERYHYVKKMLQLRKDKTPVYYIDENFIAKNDSYMSLYDNMRYASVYADRHKFLIYAVSQEELVCVKLGDSYGEDVFLRWLEDFLISLQTPSVIVLGRAKHTFEPVRVAPTIESLKVELRDWLDYHKVPHCVNMSKIELYTLARKYTDLVTSYKAENMIKLQGHQPLRVPKHMEKYTLSALVHDLIAANFVKPESINKPRERKQWIETSLQSIFASITPEILNNYSECIEKELLKILYRDTSLDKVLDQLIEASKTGYSADDDDSDLPTLSDDSD